MKVFRFVLLLLLIAAPLLAQSSLIGDVAAERAKYSVSMTPSQVAAMLNQVAWNHRAEGWGLLRKGSGNSCPLRDTFISCDILIHAPTIQHFDVLRDAENAAIPQWNNVGPCVLSDSSGCQMANFLSPFDPGGSVPPVVVPPVIVPPMPQPPVYTDLSQVTLRLDAMAAQMERIYADLAARDVQRGAQGAALAAQLERHDNDPSYFKKIFGNRYMQMLLAGAGTLATREVMK